MSDELAKQQNFQLPVDFKGYRDKGGGNPPPWLFLNDDMVLTVREMINERYTRHRDCLPFARNLMSDDFVLFTPEGKVRPLHMYASEGWESAPEYASFREWLRAALDDCIAMLERISAGQRSK